MNITLGFSPCPNDTYMFAALVNGWIDTHGLTFDVHMEDVETLNELAGHQQLDVTKISFHRALSLDHLYQLLSSGAALGNGCGPLLIAREMLTKEAILKGPVALPGQWTTAHLLFNLFYPEATNKLFYPFHKIEEALIKGEVAAGVIIHENRFTYQSKGLIKVLDLGEAWEESTGMPIPLGGIFASKQLSEDTISLIDSLLKESILFARNNTDLVMPYVRRFSQEMDEDVIHSHISLYVNDFSVDLGEKGINAIARLKKMVP